MYVEEKHEHKFGKDSKISAEWNASVNINIIKRRAMRIANTSKSLSGIGNNRRFQPSCLGPWVLICQMPFK